jgi:hypothetical protein
MQTQRNTNHLLVDDLNIIIVSLPLKYPEIYSVTFTPKLPSPLTIRVIPSNPQSAVKIRSSSSQSSPSQLKKFEGVVGHTQDGE